MKHRFLILMLPFLIVACDRGNREENVAGRWYTPSQLEHGRVVFKNNCAGCHGENAQGTFRWNKKLADGSYPPPPLNGSAHTWHHPKRLLKRTIDNGGIPVGGKMPAFKDKLTEQDKEAVIAFFQSYWPDEIYAEWLNRGGLK